MNVATQPTVEPDYDAIKAKQNATWAAGDYAKIGTTLQIVGEQLAETCDLAPGATVLDVAAGNGNATLAFARRWCRVTSTDYVDALLRKGQARAEAEDLMIAFETADVENLPYEAGAFDAVVSTFGCMFAPNQARTASEMVRVCRPGGTIGMANWTPAGFIGQVFKTLGGFVAPPPGVQSPAQWGNKDWLQSTFGAAGATVTAVERDFLFRYQSPEHFMDVFQTYYGPIHKAFQALPADKQDGLRAALLGTIGQFNVATDGTMKVPSQYLEVVVTKA